uniref:Uncharacterized protein n=1 Tax=Pipistrellus kuhlii TaxID=59472 RepID=A0A7J7S451_PIPKU|nr:hypothetical protein mPipKuh1_010193 [Pipistrellus kuhlii]
MLVLPTSLSDPLSLFPVGSTLLPQFPSCLMLMLEWARFKASCGLSPHVPFLRKAAFRSDTARDFPGLDLGSLAGGPTGLGTTGTLGPRSSHRGPAPGPGTGLWGELINKCWCVFLCAIPDQGRALAGEGLGAGPALVSGQETLVCAVKHLSVSWVTLCWTHGKAGTGTGVVPTLQLAAGASRKPGNLPDPTAASAHLPGSARPACTSVLGALSPGPSEPKPVVQLLCQQPSLVQR